MRMSSLHNLSLDLRQSRKSQKEKLRTIAQASQIALLDHHYHLIEEHRTSPFGLESSKVGVRVEMLEIHPHIHPQTTRQSLRHKHTRLGRADRRRAQDQVGAGVKKILHGDRAIHVFRIRILTARRMAKSFKPLA